MVELWGRARMLVGSLLFGEKSFRVAGLGFTLGVSVLVTLLSLFNTKCVKHDFLKNKVEWENNSLSTCLLTLTEGLEESPLARMAGF
jgi:hypothetical protein